MKIAVTSSTFSRDPVLVKELQRYFPEVSLNQGKRYSPPELVEHLQNTDGAILGLDKITGEFLDKCPNLKVISRFGVGIDNIDLEACQSRGVEVKYGKGVNAVGVAEYTLGMMIDSVRHISQNSLNLKNGVWRPADSGYNLSEKTVGIVGLGYVGRKLTELLKPFNCRILVHDVVNQETYAKENGLEQVSEDFLFENSDVISVHLPLTEQTKNFVGKNLLSLMKPNAYIVNTSRGGVMDESELYDSLSDGRIAGAALDVYQEEPAKNSQLLNLKNVVCTPHVAGNSFESNLAMGYAAINGLREHFENES